MANIRRTFATGLPTVLLLLASCVDGTGRDVEYGLAVVPELADLDGDTLVADRIVDPDRDLVPGSRITMSFTTDSVSVEAGCNTLRGAASIDDHELVVSDVASTMMACNEALEEQDQWLTSFLTSRPRFDRTDDDFHLSRDDTEIHLTLEDD
jgi:heat shock protein HslJ